ncbi:MAG: 5-formyltetrahydrofolate cyclo-ligase [Candidatus Berkiella sp.]
MWQKQQLRQRIRAKRLLLSDTVVHTCARAVTRHLLQQPEFRNAQHIALYMSFNNEISTQSIFDKALRLHKSCYLPSITSTHHLNFYKVDVDTLLCKNRFGIFEPRSHAKARYAHQFDLILVPLVAFDKALHRLGMGGGYYDRTFAFKPPASKPYLVGLGYDFQKVNQLPYSNLDVSLDMVVTEKRIYRKPI